MLNVSVLFYIQSITGFELSYFLIFFFQFIVKYNKPWLYFAVLFSITCTPPMEKFRSGSNRLSMLNGLLSVVPNSGGKLLLYQHVIFFCVHLTADRNHQVWCLNLNQYTSYIRFINKATIQY